MAKKKSYRETKKQVQKRMKVAQKIGFLKSINSSLGNMEIDTVIRDLSKALNTKRTNLDQALQKANDVNSINLLNSINSELTIKTLENRITYAKMQGETGPVNTDLSNYEISQLIKKFNELYKAGLIRETFNSADYDSSRIGEFAKSVLSPEVLEEISKKAEKYHTPTWKEKYGWDSTRTIDF